MFDGRIRAGRESVGTRRWPNLARPEERGPTYFGQFRGSLWTFAHVEGVGPDNNPAERALRHGVIRRKTSGGTDSEQGSRFVGQILSVVATCRQQGRDVLGYLTECFGAHFQGRPTLSLLS